jgi:ADP-ribose pyrophosphatase YjhB (NUDIX family)
MGDKMAHYCFQCGHELVWKEIEGRQREICPVCQRIHYEQLKLSAGTLVEQDGAILLVQRACEPWRGMWYLPAGYLEVDERPPLGAVRETCEETGLQVEITGLMDAYFYDDDPRGNGVVIIYHARVTGGHLQPGPEALDCRFFAPDSLPAALLDGHKAAVGIWVSQKRSMS